MLKIEILNTPPALFGRMAFFATAKSGGRQVKQTERRRNRVATLPKAKVREYKLYGYTDRTELIYTAASNCKMLCLDIDERRLREILKNGIVNVEMSNLRSNPKKYTVEYFLPTTLNRVMVVPDNTSLKVFSLEKDKSNTRCNGD